MILPTHQLFLVKWLFEHKYYEDTALYSHWYNVANIVGENGSIGYQVIITGSFGSFLSCEGRCNYLLPKKQAVTFDEFAENVTDTLNQFQILVSEVSHGLIVPQFEAPGREFLVSLHERFLQTRDQ